MRTMLVTGSSGLIGSAVVAYFSRGNWAIHGVDNNMRADSFGPSGDTRWNERRLRSTWNHFTHHELDIRDRRGCADLPAAVKPEVVVHTPAQPSHDLAASRPFDDFDVNAVGTLNLLEGYRQAIPGGLRAREHEQGLR